MELMNCGFAVDMQYRHGIIGFLNLVLETTRLAGLLGSFKTVR